MSIHKPQFADPNWITVASKHGILAFDDIWSITGTQIDATNRGRGGWSNVVRRSFARPGGGALDVFIKRQVNYTSRTLRHPIARVPTLEREYRAIRLLSDSGVTVPRVLYFSVHRTNSEWRAILITEALADYESLEQLKRRDLPLEDHRQHVIAAATLLKAIHATGRRHNCFYPKHIFLHQREGVMHPCIIDLEKVRWSAFGTRAHLRDIRTLFNRCPTWTRAQRLRFLLAYVGADRVGPSVRFMWAALRKPKSMISMENEHGTVRRRMDYFRRVSQS